MKKKILGDSKAGISQLTSDGGSWRTRHLRIRSAKLRELLQHGDGDWSIEHRDGNSLVSDGLTKALQKAKFASYISMLGMVTQETEPQQGGAGPKVRSMRSGLEMDVAKVALGAGVAMLLKNYKTEGILLLAAAGLSACYGFYEQETKRPEKKKRPQQNSRDQEPPKGMTDEAAHLPKEENGVTGKPMDFLGCPRDNGSVGRDGPGLRAYRVTSGGASSNGGGKGKSTAAASGSSSSGKGSTAAARGRAVGTSWMGESQQSGREQTMSMNLQSESGDLVREHRALGQAVETTPAEGRRHADGRYEEPHEGYSVAATSSSLEASGFTGWMRAEGVASTPPRPETGESDDDDSGSSKGIPMNPKVIQRNREHKSPWLLPRYTQAPTRRSDDWDLSLYRSHGWLVRVHGKPRKRCFHPIHRSTPTSAADFADTRVSSVFEQNARHRILPDLWKDPANVEVEGLRTPWVGYTFFKVLSRDEDQQVPVARTTSPTEESDGSFEKVP